MSLSNLQESTSPLPLPASSNNWRDTLRMLAVLFKLRVVSLLLFAAVGGAFLGARGWPGLGLFLLVLVTGLLAAAGASALNQYWERDSDAKMGRTKERPLVAGNLNPASQRWVPFVAIAMVFLPVGLTFLFNRALAFYLLLGAFIYVGVYTVWLKPRTLLNIVIGGAAGSAAVMSGGAAVGAASDPFVITLALLVFLWTPAHFWSLAILYRDDYQKADTPMLPAYTSTSTAGWWVMVHTLATGFAALILVLSPDLGWVYFFPVLLATADLIWRNVKLVRQPSRLHARKFFLGSNIYLAIILIVMMIDVMLPF